MNWQQYIEFLREQGFTGDGESLPGVQKWLGENGFDTEEVEGEDSRVYELKTLFEQRPGRKMNVGAVEAKAATQEYITAQVRAGIEEVAAHTGMHKVGGEPVDSPDHTVIGKVHTRLADDPCGGFRNLGHFSKQVFEFVINNQTHRPESELELWSKAAPTTWSSVEVGSDGGFAVPTEFRDRITSLVMGEDSIVSRCDQFPISRTGIKLPADETTPWEQGGGTTGGVMAYWEGEGRPIRQSKINLEQKELRLRKVTALVPATEELMEDMTATGEYITRKAGEVLDFKVGEAIWRGTGSGMPLGFLNGGSTIEVTPDPAQATTGKPLTAENVFDMWSRMYAPSRRNAVWFVHQDLEPSMLGMTLQATDAAGASPSGGGPIYLAGGTAATAPFSSLLNRPVIATQHCSAIRSPGDIVFAAMDKYICTLKAGGIETATSIHLWFDQDLVAFRFRMRVDGQPWRRKEIPPRDANAKTLSDFITLGDRS